MLRTDTRGSCSLLPARGEKGSPICARRQTDWVSAQQPYADGISSFYHPTPTALKLLQNAICGNKLNALFEVFEVFEVSGLFVLSGLFV